MDALPLLSRYARVRKTSFFFRDVAKDRRILEIGCGDGWLGAWLRANGWRHYTGLDLHPPADIVGDVRNWRSLGLEPESFDIVVAFELVEHVDCFEAMHALLKPGGRLMLTSPAPGMDWFCRLLEILRLTQRRTSPHNHLIAFEHIPLFMPVTIRRVGLAAQWGVFEKQR